MGGWGGAGLGACSPVKFYLWSFLDQSLRLFLGDWHCDIAVCAELGYKYMTVSCENRDPGSPYFGKIATRGPFVKIGTPSSLEKYRATNV